MQLRPPAGMAGQKRASCECWEDESWALPTAGDAQPAGTEWWLLRVTRGLISRTPGMSSRERKAYVHTKCAHGCSCSIVHTATWVRLSRRPSARDSKQHMVNPHQGRLSGREMSLPWHRVAGPQPAPQRKKLDTKAHRWHNSRV